MIRGITIYPLHQLLISRMQPMYQKNLISNCIMVSFSIFCSVEFNMKLTPAQIRNDEVFFHLSFSQSKSNLLSEMLYYWVYECLIPTTMQQESFLIIFMNDFISKVFCFRSAINGVTMATKVLCVRYITVADLAIISQTTPVFVCIIAVVVLGEKITLIDSFIIIRHFPCKRIMKISPKKRSLT